jgi:hypothetical protein
MTRVRKNVPSDVLLLMLMTPDIISEADIIAYLEEQDVLLQDLDESLNYTMFKTLPEHKSKIIFDAETIILEMNGSINK